MENSLQKRLRIVIQGAVQGVGFRPFVYRLATELGLTGWVCNSAQGVAIEVEGSLVDLEAFQLRLDQEKPSCAVIQQRTTHFLSPVRDPGFEIRASLMGEKTAIVLPDLAPCADCLRELEDPRNRRYRYPFINCTHCGPRYSILQALPYDRPHTTMRAFEMCDRCWAEYRDPRNRRFHAQPNACPNCGPSLELWDTQGQRLVSGETALQQGVAAIQQGKILALKGLGGFQLLVDAGNTAAVQRLRQVKRRTAKPLALMYPSLDLVKAHCQVSALEAELLGSPVAPIVLLQRLTGGMNAEARSPVGAVAPNNPYLGVMLPSTPLHHLLLGALNRPLVATSGNYSGEPICIDEQQAISTLGKIADLLLVHNRPIARPVDDSVVRILMGREIILRRARGYAPLPVAVDPHPRDNSLPQVLATGAHLKNTVALTLPQQILLSQHIGDLETLATVEVWQQTIAGLTRLYDRYPTLVACDAHPDYHSTQLAQQLGLPVLPVQHHYAHVLACMAEHQLQGSVLGVAWDGTGYGLDGTIWGGEFLQVIDSGWRRLAHLRSWPLPGGEQAIREPRRAAIGLLYEQFGDRLGSLLSLAPGQAFTPLELKILQTMLHRKLNTPLTSSAGRLFDGVASLLGLRQQTEFEGQAAMDLEFAAAAIDTNESYAFELREVSSCPLVADWGPMMIQIVADLSRGASPGLIAAKFHNTLVEMIVDVARWVGEPQIVLTGGCFQNQYLTERAIQRLRAAHFCPYWHQRVPPNDGGIALGQAVAALRELRGQNHVFSGSGTNSQD